MTFTTAEQAMIRHAVEDVAGSWYGQVGPFTFGRDEAARYTAEGVLGKLCDRHGLGPVWRAVTEHIDEHPEVLEHRYTIEQQRERRQRRTEAARELANEAARAFQAGDHDRCLDLIDEAEQLDPTYQPACRSWDELRQVVSAAVAG